MGVETELRHLRYFVAVAEAGSLTEEAERKPHTSQPSLRRQIRDPEDDLGAQLLTRSARGVELTPGVEPFSITLAWCYRRLKRQRKLHAGALRF